MNTRRSYKSTFLALVAIVGLLGSTSDVFANAADDLKAEIQNKQAEISSINKKLDEYKAKITEYAKKSASLQNDVAMIENDTAMTELDVAATQTQIDSAQLELQVLGGEVDEASAKLTKEREMLSNLVFALHKQDVSGEQLEMFVAAKNIDDVFRAAADLETVNVDLKKTLSATQMTKNDLEDKMADQNKKVTDLGLLEEQLSQRVKALDGQKQAKLVLATEADNSEAGYKVLMSELRQEQQAITARINALQNKVQDQISDTEEADSNPSAITWPLHGTITATFHDPSYPFRNLFPHSGTDIAVPQGTAVAAAAPGVVAWARTGTDYGNYIMIIHAGGLATLYAHLSRIDVKQDQYVSRGEIIGLSGGRPGTQGAGLSTGSHLHFEVRSGGIPVNAQNYLP
jgi:murein DD-endopeptidase MepM/ murein hydrolase activator NlpD